MTDNRQVKDQNKVKILVFIFFGVFVLFLINISVGSVNIPLKEVLRIIFSPGIENQAWTNIIIKSRIPEAITASLAGAGLAVGGLLMQTLFRNPLTGPSILGISSGAGLGVAFIMLFMGGQAGVLLSGVSFLAKISSVLAASAGAILVLFLILFLARKVKDNVMLLIIGIMVGYISSALVGVLNYYGMQENVHSFVLWGLGSFSNITWSQMQIFIPSIIIGLSFSFLLIKALNMLILGENYARNLGLDINKARTYIIICTGFLTAVITAFCGPIAFLGLAVPHISKLLLKSSNHKVLVPAVILTGALLALFCNLVAKLPGFEGALPINAITSLIGAPVVILIIMRKK